jgi:hypothetical protein
MVAPARMQRTTQVPSTGGLEDALTLVVPARSTSINPMQPWNWPCKNGTPSHASRPCRGLSWYRMRPRWRSIWHAPYQWLPRCTSDPIQTAVSSLSLRSCKRSMQHAARSTHPARPDNSLAAHCGCAWDECRASARVQVKLGGLEQERHGRGQHQASPAQRTSDFFTGSYAVDPRKEKRGEARPLDARFADPHE